MVPSYSMTGPFREHMSLKSSPHFPHYRVLELGLGSPRAFSPGPSCKLSNQYLIQDHMAAHYKNLMSAKAAVDSSAPKSLHTSVKCITVLSKCAICVGYHVFQRKAARRKFGLLDGDADLCKPIKIKRKTQTATKNSSEKTEENTSFKTSLLFQTSSGVKHQPILLKRLVGIKAELPLRAKNEGTSQDKDQQKRDRLIQALEKYKKDLVHGLPASSCNSRSVSPSQQKAGWSLLENGHLYLTSGRNSCSKTKREQAPSVSSQKITSRALLPGSTARKNTQNSAQHALSQTPVHSSGTDRSSASPFQQSHMHLRSHNMKKTSPNSFNKTYSGDLLNKHSIYFTEKTQCFTPRILKTSHQSFLVKYRYYNPPSPKKISSPGRPSLQSADVTDEKKRELHRFLEDAHARPHSPAFSQEPVEVGATSLFQRKRMEPTVHTKKLSRLCGNEMNYALRIPSSEMLFSPGSQLEEKEEEDLRFLQDLTNDIFIRNCYHKEALEDVFQMHIKSKRHNLDEVKRRRIVQSLKKELNITDQPDPSNSCDGAERKDTSIPATCC